MNHQTTHTSHEPVLDGFQMKGAISAILSLLSWILTLSNIQTVLTLVLTLLAIAYNAWNLYDKWKAARQPPPAPDVISEKLNISYPPNPLKPNEKTQ